MPVNSPKFFPKYLPFGFLAHKDTGVCRKTSEKRFTQRRGDAKDAEELR